MFSKISLQINTDLNASERVLSWFEQLDRPPIPDRNIWWQCQTLLQEGFINIVEHAHQELSSDTPIEIEAIRSDKTIEIRIWGYGKPFDLQKQLQETPDFLDNDRERGRGLRIMSAIADELKYFPTEDGRYCFLTIKHY